MMKGYWSEDFMLGLCIEKTQCNVECSHNVKEDLWKQRHSLFLWSSLSCLARAKLQVPNETSNLPQSENFIAVVTVSQKANPHLINIAGQPAHELGALHKLQMASLLLSVFLQIPPLHSTVGAKAWCFPQSLTKSIPAMQKVDQPYFLHM